jgi:hypothetical protein
MGLKGFPMIPLNWKEKEAKVDKGKAESLKRS